MKSKTILWVVVLVILVALPLGYYYLYASTPGPLDGFAECLKDKGATFYGAFWCPHCQAQKALFGKSKSKLPYVECSSADGQSQLPVCKEKKIEGYPTWIFADGSRLSGEVSLDDLASTTGCTLP